MKRLMLIHKNCLFLEDMIAKNGMALTADESWMIRRRAWDIRECFDNAFSIKPCFKHAFHFFIAFFVHGDEDGKRSRQSIFLKFQVSMDKRM
jgi:hypothetical protein